MTKVNVNGVYFTTIAMIPLLRKSSLPVVINIASLAALGLQRRGSSITLGATKAGSGSLPKRLLANTQTSTSLPFSPRDSSPSRFASTQCALASSPHP
jgi:NAD(P)-dependent dehydrogenase (short-subunit alcohol dehydrogenase family)